MRHLLLIVMLFLTGCSMQQINDRLSTPEEQAMALKAANAIRAGDYDGFDRIIYPPLRDEVTPESFAKFKPMIPKGGGMVLRTVSVQMNDGVTMKSFNYDVGSGNHWAIVQITLRTSSNPLVVAGYRVWPMERAPEVTPDFNFKAAGAIQYLWIFAMILAVGVSLTGFVQVLRTRGLRLKWLWAVGCLVSVTAFQLNWSTGASGVFPIYFVLFGAGAFQPLSFGSMILQFGIPVVAIVFLIRKATGAFDRDPLEGTDVFS